MYQQFMSRLRAAHTLLRKNGSHMNIINNDDRGPQVIHTCTDILVQWYEHSGVEHQDLAEAICTDIQQAIEDMLYHREKEMQAQQ